MSSDTDYSGSTVCTVRSRFCSDYLHCKKSVHVWQITVTCKFLTHYFAWNEFSRLCFKFFRNPRIIIYHCTIGVGDFIEYNSPLRDKTASQTGRYFGIDLYVTMLKKKTCWPRTVTHMFQRGTSLIVLNQITRKRVHPSRAAPIAIVEMRNHTCRQLSHESIVCSMDIAAPIRGAERISKSKPQSCFLIPPLQQQFAHLRDS